MKLQIDHLFDVVPRQGFEEDNLVNPVEKFRADRLRSRSHRAETSRLRACKAFRLKRTPHRAGMQGLRSCMRTRLRCTHLRQALSRRQALATPSTPKRRVAAAFLLASSNAPLSWRRFQAAASLRDLLPRAFKGTPQVAAISRSAANRRKFRRMSLPAARST